MGDYNSQWEYQSLWWSKQTAWHASIPTTLFKKVPNNNKPWLVSPRPAILQAAGSGDGLPFGTQWRASVGAPGFKNQTTHPATQQIIADAFYLLFQGQTAMYTSTHTYLSTHNAAGTVITWVADPTWVYATLLAINDGGADPSSAMRADTCVASSVGVNIPADGLTEVTIDWLGYEGVRNTTYTNTTPTTDTGDHWHRKDWAFKIGATAYDFTIANFVTTNGLVHKANMAGFLLGTIGITGSITLLFHADSGSAPDLLLDSLEDPTNASSLRTFHFIHTDGAGNEDFDSAFPVLPTGQPSRGDLGGGVTTLTFNFVICGAAASYPIYKIDDTVDFDLLNSVFYTAP